MNKRTKLVLGRGIFVFFVTIAFGLIIINEKGNTIMLPKIEKKINEYYEENYKNIENEINKDEIEYKNKKYYLKLKSKKNSNHFFYIIYSNKQITDTYKKDFIEGKKLYNYLEKTLEKEIEDKTNLSTKVEFITTFDKFTTKVQERILKEDNLTNLKFYTIKKEININIWDSKTILNEITKTISLYEKNNISPKNYTIILTNTKDITQSVEIKNITYDFLNNKNNLQIISDIINDSNTLILKESKITYSYLN